MGCGLARGGFPRATAQLPGVCVNHLYLVNMQCDSGRAERPCLTSSHVTLGPGHSEKHGVRHRSPQSPAPHSWEGWAQPPLTGNQGGTGDGWKDPSPAFRLQGNSEFLASIRPRPFQAVGEGVNRRKSSACISEESTQIYVDQIHSRPVAQPEGGTRPPTETQAGTDTHPWEDDP